MVNRKKGMRKWISMVGIINSVMIQLLSIIIAGLILGCGDRNKHESDYRKYEIPSDLTQCFEEEDGDYPATIKPIGGESTSGYRTRVIVKNCKVATFDIYGKQYAYGKDFYHEELQKGLASVRLKTGDLWDISLNH